MTPPIEERNVNGSRVWISERPGAPLMVLTRMAPGGMGLWNRIWPRLAEHFTVANFDLPVPPFNKGDDPRDVYRALGQSVIETAEALGHPRFHLFGWTGGAHVGLRMLVEQPERLLSCVLLGAIYEPEEQRPLAYQLEMLRRMLGRDNSDADLDFYTRFWILSSVSPEWAEKHWDEIDQLVARRLAADRGRLDPATVFDWLTSMRRQSVTEAELAQVRTPTLLLAPALSGWPPLHWVRRLHAAMPSAELAVIPRGQDFALIEDPDAVMAAAGPFLRAAASAKSRSIDLAEADRRTVLSEGTRIDVVEPSADKAVVFLHGWLMTPEIWAPAMAALSDRVRVLAPWAPAHGGSSALSLEASLDEWALSLAAMLERLGVKKAILVGHSMGGMQALALAELRPDMVAGLVLVGSQIESWPEDRRLEMGRAADALAVAWSEDLASELAKTLVGDAFLADNPAWIGSWFHTVSGWDLPGHSSLARAVANRPDRSNAWRAFTGPRMIVHGGADRAISVAVAQAAATSESCDLRVLEDVGHCPPLEAPDAFTALLTSYLAEHGVIARLPPPESA
jgi:pimeloyl-ACP methyl ester carboxylesterase